jgi:CBS domain-containing protein
MPMLLGAKGKDILQWRATEQLMESFSSGLEMKWNLGSAHDAEHFIGKIIETLGDELGYEAQLVSELSALDEGIEAAASYRELQPLLVRYREVVSAHFSRRRSVLALCSICSRLHDRVLSKATYLAKARMLELGQGPAPVHAVLVSGDRGRGEQTLFGENRYFLLHEEESERFYLFSRQLSTSLKELGLLSADQMFWHGSLAEWRELLTTSFSIWRSRDEGSPLAPLAPFGAPRQHALMEVPEWEWRLEALTDLCSIEGYAPLAQEARNAAKTTVREERGRAPFQQLTRRVIALPLATGRFGKWRSQRDGEHKGELNLEDLAIAPLVMTIRVMAVQADVDAGGTLQRIEGLLEKGALDVDLADRLLKAYQCLMQYRIDSEIRNGEPGAVCVPEEFDEAQEYQLRTAVETVLNLQKIAYQRMVGMG